MVNIPKECGLSFRLDPYNLFFTHILKFFNMLAAFDKFYMHQNENFGFFLDLFKSFVIFIPLKWHIIAWLSIILTSEANLNNRFEDSSSTKIALTLT